VTGGVPWTVLADGILLLTVRLTPRGGRDAIDGVATLDDGRCVLKARVRATPAEGEANDALVRLAARAAGVAPRADDGGCDVAGEDVED
jgi:uncharacterized protein YggU (UPF0235/DUF167 family)